jgi:hypothetical protein
MPPLTQKTLLMHNQHVWLAVVFMTCIVLLSQFQLPAVAYYYAIGERAGVLLQRLL